MAENTQKPYSFSDSDLTELSGHELSLDEAERQLVLLLCPPRYIPLQRACTLGDGISVLPDSAHNEYIALHEDAAKAGRILKFVPASGAASRMFRDLSVFHNHKQPPTLDELKQKAASGDKEASSLMTFLSNIEKFAFANTLTKCLEQKGHSLQKLLNEKKYSDILKITLCSDGICYSQLPKGLIEFHKYSDHSRTPFEEHLVEAAETVRDSNGICKLHFTISPEHESRFKERLEERRQKYEKDLNVKLEVEFSVQKLSTDMLALGPDKKPFHDENGQLLLRPGGHGALIENLNDLKGDLIFIKNIDNVQPDSSKQTTLKYKKLLCGYLLHVQAQIHSHLKALHSSGLSDTILDETLHFSRQELCIAITDNKWSSLDSPQARRDFLIRKLDRPLRVCGVVKNTGEPGGGPFWVQGDDGALNLQIVEGAQIDHASTTQSKIFYASTHFNPVDIVCSVRNFRGQVFDLKKYVDDKAVIRTHKSYQGRDLLACERPGLWNGAMSDWITLFVEVPEETFTPVKSVNDLLRPSHQ